VAASRMKNGSLRTTEDQFFSQVAEVKVFDVEGRSRFRAF
jgi:hypothetical protein